MAVVRWWKRLYTSELFVFLPVLTWFKLRQTWAQITCDLVRTIPLIVTICVAVVKPVHWLAWLVVVLWTVFANYAMYKIDDHVYKRVDYNNFRTHKKLFDYDSRAEMLFFFSVVLSPIGFLTGSPSFMTGLPSSKSFLIVLSLNLVAVIYVTFSLLFVAPFVKDWACYPEPRTPASLKFGFCPTNPEERVNNHACLMLGLDTSRCSADYKQNLLGESGIDVHFVIHLVVISSCIFFAEVMPLLYDLYEIASIKKNN